MTLRSTILGQVNAIITLGTAGDHTMLLGATGILKKRLYAALATNAAITQEDLTALRSDTDLIAVHADATFDDDIIAAVQALGAAIEAAMVATFPDLEWQEPAPEPEQEGA